MTMRRSLAVLVLLLLAGCRSSPSTHFYALSVVPGNGGSPAAVPFPVQVATVHLPPLLDRRQLVRMTGENSVQISGTERWSAALDEMVRNVLSQDLAARLPEGRVILPDAPPPPDTGTLVVTIAQFGPDATGDVHLNGSWALLTGGSNTPILKRDFHLDARPAASADAMAAAMSRALGQLASVIAVTLSPGDISISQPRQRP
jgi:uncharacterized lipoprotein YmbA